MQLPIWIVIWIVPTLIHSATFESFNYQLSGRPMAANSLLIVAIQDRSAPSFSVVQNYTYGSTPRFCTTTFSSPLVPDLYAMMVAVARNTGITKNTNTFVFIGYSQSNSNLYLVTTSINFGNCKLTSNLSQIATNTSFPEYSTLGLDADGEIAFYFWNGGMYVHLMNNLNEPKRIYNVTLPSYQSFYPISVDLLKDWGVVTCYSGSLTNVSPAHIIRPRIFLFKYDNCNSTTWNNSCYFFLGPASVPYSFSSRAFPATVGDMIEDSYNPLYDISVAINDDGGILVGMQSMFSVYRYQYVGNGFSFIDSRSKSQGTTVGFGKSVGWLDSQTVAILYNTWEPQYTSWKSSVLELHEVTSGYSLSNYREPSVNFPNDRQKLWSSLDQQIVEMTADAATSSLIYMDVGGTVHVIRSTPPGWYSQSNNGSGSGNVTIYLAPTVPCQSGMTKNMPSSGINIFLRCDICREGTYYLATQYTTANYCLPCNLSQSFCPHGAVNELPTDILSPVLQIQTYPLTPENDILEDILLLNMFSIDMSMSCVLKQPIFLASAIIAFGILILLFMALLKITKTCKGFRRVLKSILRQTDLIGEGELWIGGLASFAVMVMCVFAYRFCDGFMKQYPSETAGPSTFACDQELVNAKFSTTMQSLATPVSESNEPVFALLDAQVFTLNVDFISTAFTENLLTVYQLSGEYLKTVNYTLTYQNGTLRAATVLPIHTLAVQFQFKDNFPIGAVRVGLSAPFVEEDNSQVQELNFSEVFNYTGRIMTQDPQITIQLIRSINETQPLSNSDDSQYSAIWTSIFVYNNDQMFYSDTNYRLYHNKDQSVFIVRLTEASYFIFNVQEPITRLTEVIFTSLLFSTMCIELFALMFLFYKLAMHSCFKLIFSRWFEKSARKRQQRQAGGCPYCQPFDIDALPVHQLPIQRLNQQQPQYAIQRRKQ